MIPWIKVYSNLPSHPKTMRLAEELKLSSAAVSPKVIAVGIVVSLWTWAIQNAYDGDLSRCSALGIADACGWKKKPDILIEALKAAGFLDDNMMLHDWEEYTVAMIDAEEDRKEKTRDRVRKFRERKREEMAATPCQYCGAPSTGYDHIIPISEGGSDNDDNKVPCCLKCNASKKERPLVTFLNDNIHRVNVKSVTECEKLSRYVRYNLERNCFVTVTERKSNITEMPSNAPREDEDEDKTRVDGDKDEKFLLRGSVKGACARPHTRVDVPSETSKTVSGETTAGFGEKLYDSFVKFRASAGDKTDYAKIKTRLLPLIERYGIISVDDAASVALRNGKAGMAEYIEGVLRNKGAAR